MRSVFVTESHFMRVHYNACKQHCRVKGIPESIIQKHKQKRQLGHAMFTIREVLDIHTPMWVTLCIQKWILVQHTCTHTVMAS